MVAVRCQNLTFEAIAAIVFDKDGTLEDSAAFLRATGQKRSRLLDARIPGIGEPLLMAFGIDGDAIDPAGLMAVGSRQENEIAAAAYIAETGREWLESLEIARNAFVEADEVLGRSEPAPLFPGCREVLATLSNAGIKLAILSADTSEAVSAFVSHHKLEAFFQLWVGTDDLSVAKPDPARLRQVCLDLDVPLEKTLVVGDSAVDVEMGKRALAAGAIAICWRGRPPNRLRGANVTIARLDEIQIIS